MPNYQNGKIYKLISDQSDKIYIGSTTQSLSRRLAKHKSDYHVNKKNNTCTISSLLIVQFSDVKIILIEKCPCDNIEELLSREQYWIDFFKSQIINKNDAVKNVEKVKQNKKIYYNNNKEKLSDYHKQHYQENSDKIKENVTKYREENRETILERKNQPHICETCGGHYTHDNKARHMKSKEHLNPQTKEQKAIQVKQKAIIRETKLVVCDCGVSYQHRCRARHFKTQQHQKYLLTQQ